MKLSNRLELILNFAKSFAHKAHNEFFTPELALIGICNRSEEFDVLCHQYDLTAEDFKIFTFSAIEAVILDVRIEDIEPEMSYQLACTIDYAATLATEQQCTEIDIHHFLISIFQLEDSYAKNCLLLLTENIDELTKAINEIYTSPLPIATAPQHSTDDIQPDENEEEEKEETDDSIFDDNDIFGDDDDDIYGINTQPDWTKFVTCINDNLEFHNPLIGREKEIERTIQVLCRKEKNNPLHIGEPGVGKTALIYGLAQRIKDGNVPQRLRDFKIYQMDMSDIVAGSQFRGEFEKRLKVIMEGVLKQGKVIIYIDEIHTLIGSGANSNEPMDGANILKPYLESGDIRFIGATTYKEYNRYLDKTQGIARRFQKIDIPEPTIDQATEILEGLQAKYESFHQVKYAKGMMRYAVELSTKHIHNRFLPDKAIDLIDEAGAYCEVHPKESKRKQVVGIDILNETIKRICHLTDQMLVESNKGNDDLASLNERLQKQIFGQQEAVSKVVEAIQIAKAGLNDPEKPIASMLFVGPTGVGKTELCRILAKEMNIELVRFDMSEYTEKHTVAKLIGSPAGYVGYDDGGLLTDAIRKSPNCVLLLDEIEKAHSDIYNVLLQVMDYARLTDNRGNKIDFRNVILIMTSNAGAQYASMASVGFGNTTSRGQSMMQTIKRTFKPEFINRLNATIVFNDMNEQMAQQILNKKLSLLNDRLKKKNVSATFSKPALRFLLNKGFTPQYGAREMDRVLNQYVNPLMVREILFGKLKRGGDIIVDLADDQLIVKKN